MPLLNSRIGRGSLVIGVCCRLATSCPFLFWFASIWQGLTFGDLQDAFLDRSLPIEIRWLAIITLKQGVDKYWRKTAKKYDPVFTVLGGLSTDTSRSSIDKEEKAHLRSRLISGAIDEPHPQLAVQSAVIVAKVARLEYPSDWPDAFKEITSIIRDASQSNSVDGRGETASTLRLTRSLSIMLHVVKELATGRLTRTKSSLRSVTPWVFRELGGVYIRNVEAWNGLVRQQPPPAGLADSMTISLLALKILSRLIVSGYEFPHRVVEVKELWTILSGQVWAMLGAEAQMPPAEEAILVLLRKHVINMGKLFLDISMSHPTAFALLPDTLPLLGKYWDVVVAHGDTLVQQSKRAADGTNGDREAEMGAGEERKKFRQRVALQGMLLFRSCLRNIFSPISTIKCMFALSELR